MSKWLRGTKLTEPEVAHTYAWHPGEPTHFPGPAYGLEASGPYSAQVTNNAWQGNGYHSGPATLQEVVTPEKSYQAIRPKGEGEQRAAPPDTFNADEANNSRGRKRALSPEGRKNARHVRSIRACGRCHALKGKVRFQSAV